MRAVEKEVREVLDRGTAQVAGRGVGLTDPVLVGKKKKGVTLRSEFAKLRANESGERGFRWVNSRDLVREPRRRNRSPPGLEMGNLEEAKGGTKGDRENKGGRRAPSLAIRFALSFPGTLQCVGVHWRWTPTPQVPRSESTAQMSKKVPER